MHASTFGGNPIACRAGLAAIETIEADGLLDRGRAVGERFRAHFETLEAGDARLDPRHPDHGGDDRPGAVRSTRPPVVADCMEHGLLINATHGTVIRLLPALNILDEQVDEGCGLLLEALRRSAS